ncbi:MAG: YicC family protein [Deltaproteobacteria bacterium]|nr:YicC family protein [Deltaproteobacteria bacterium]
MRSMTGYGRGVARRGDLQIVVDVKSVNHKGLDVKVRLPRESAPQEAQVLRLVQSTVQRGRVDVTCEIETLSAARAALDVEGLIALVGEVRRVGEQIAAVPGITEGDLLRAGLQLRHAAPTAADTAPLLLEAVTMALAGLEQSRAREGETLGHLLEERLITIARLSAELRGRAIDAPQRAAERLTARVRALAVEVDAGRLAQEAALLADRLDVTEELERLAMHVELGRSLLAATEPSGRKLDFLCQELLREANTAGSKVQDASATHLVVELKCEIERLREQAQNVE